MNPIQSRNYLLYDQMELVYVPHPVGGRLVLHHRLHHIDGIREPVAGSLLYGNNINLDFRELF
jgi:hypothetical protein